MKNAIFAVVVFLSALAMFSGAVLADGKILKVSYDPEEVFALSDIKMEIGVENIDDKDNDYKLVVSVVSEGLIESEQKFTFALGPQKKRTFSSEFTPRSIGSYKIIAKLYDENEIDLYDTEIRPFNSLSEIGPFDLKVDLPTKIVRPNSRVPIITFLENKGAKSTDVELQVKLRCANGDIKENFYELAEAGNQIEKVFAFQSCATPGIYDVIADVMLFNKTWISSSSQIIVDNYLTELFFLPPNQIVVESGKSSLFTVEVKNIGDSEIDSLRLIVTRIPVEWIGILPPEIINIRPKGEAVFIVNITVPPSAKNREINFTFIATASDTQVEHRSVMKISGMAPASKISEDGSKFTFGFPKIDLPSFESLSFDNFYVFMFVMIAVPSIAGGTLFVMKRSWKNERNQSFAYKIHKIRKTVTDEK